MSRVEPASEPQTPQSQAEAKAFSHSGDALAVSAASLVCTSVKPNRLLRSSRDLGWRSILLDHQRGVGRSPVFETHPTEDVTLVVATWGRSMIQVLKNGAWRTAMYEVGNAGLTCPNDTSRMSWQALGPDDRFETAHMYLSASLVRDVEEEYRRAGRPSSEQPLSALVFQDPTLSSIAGTLLSAMHRSAPSLYAEQASRFIVTHLLARHAQWWDVESDRRAAPVLSDRQVGRAIEYMSARLGEDITLKELAAEACISVNHFVRRFRERTGSTPFAYLTRLRMDAARGMLSTSELPISEVAALCGYSNAGAFSSAFQRHVGSSPSTFRGERQLKSSDRA
jgi:AraC family transcriptional regulator